MKVLYWLILAAPLSVGCDGEGTSKADALERECLAFCEDLSGYISRCAEMFESDGEGAEINEWCPGHCSDYGKETPENECEDVFERYVDCLNATNWAGLACSEEEAEAAVVPCWEIQSELDYCVNSNEERVDTGFGHTGGSH